MSVWAAGAVAVLASLTAAALQLATPHAPEVPPLLAVGLCGWCRVYWVGVARAALLD